MYQRCLYFRELIRGRLVAVSCEPAAAPAQSTKAFSPNLAGWPRVAERPTNGRICSGPRSRKRTEGVKHANGASKDKLRFDPCQRNLTSFQTAMRLTSPAARPAHLQGAVVARLSTALPSLLTRSRNQRRSRTRREKYAHWRRCDR